MAAALLAIEALGGPEIEDVEAPSAKPTNQTSRATRFTKKAWPTSERCTKPWRVGGKRRGRGGKEVPPPPRSPRLDTERVFSLAAAPVALVQGNVVGFAGAGVDLAWAGDLKLLIVH